MRWPSANSARSQVSFSMAASAASSVVVPGSLPKDGGRYNLNAAIIVKRVDAQTRAKTAINDLLRD